jgi:hypothetical protein
VPQMPVCGYERNLFVRFVAGGCHYSWLAGMR